MLTDLATPVDAAPSSVMWTPSQIAERDGISRQAVSKSIKALVKNHGLSAETNGRGNIVRINVAEYDHLRGRVADPSKAQRPAAPLSQAIADIKSSESYDEALRQRTWIEAERARLKLAAERGEYLRAESVSAALLQCGEDITRAIDRFGAATDEMAAAVAKDGVHGLRVIIKQVIFRIKGEVAKALEQLANDAPETEPVDSVEAEPVA